MFRRGGGEAGAISSPIRTSQSGNCPKLLNVDRRKTKSFRLAGSFPMRALSRWGLRTFRAVHVPWHFDLYHGDLSPSCIETPPDAFLPARHWLHRCSSPCNSHSIDPRSGLSLTPLILHRNVAQVALGNGFQRKWAKAEKEVRRKSRSLGTIGTWNPPVRSDVT